MFDPNLCGAREARFRKSETKTGRSCIVRVETFSDLGSLVARSVKDTLVLPPVQCIPVPNDYAVDEPHSVGDVKILSDFVPISKSILIPDNRIRPRVDLIVEYNLSGGKSLY